MLDDEAVEPEPTAPERGVEAPAQPAGDGIDAETAALLRDPEVGEHHAAEPAAAASRRRGFRPRGRTAVAAAAVVVVVAIAAGAVLATRVGTSANVAATSPATTRALATATSAPPSATPSIAPSPTDPGDDADQSAGPSDVDLSTGAGKVVFSDDFHDASAGWTTAGTKLTTFSLTSGTYLVSGTGSLTDHLVEAPFADRFSEVVVTAVGSQTSGRGTAGFGVTCGSAAETAPDVPLPNGTPTAGSSAAPARSAAASPTPAPQGILYEFVILNNGGWLVERRDGSPTRSARPVVLMQGITGVVAGSEPITVSGICATSTDGTRTRLVLAIDGTKVIEFSDLTSEITQGWRGGIVVSTVSTGASVSFTRFEVRNLAAAP